MKKSNRRIIERDQCLTMVTRSCDRTWRDGVYECSDFGWQIDCFVPLTMTRKVRCANPMDSNENAPLSFNGRVPARAHERSNIGTGTHAEILSVSSVRWHASGASPSPAETTRCTLCTIYMYDDHEYC